MLEPWYLTIILQKYYNKVFFDLLLIITYKKNASDWSLIPSFLCILLPSLASRLWTVAVAVGNSITTSTRPSQKKHLTVCRTRTRKCLLDHVFAELYKDRYLLTTYQVTNPSRKPLQSAITEKHPSSGCNKIQRKLQMIETGHAITNNRINPAWWSFVSKTEEGMSSKKKKRNERLIKPHPRWRVIARDSFLVRLTA